MDIPLSESALSSKTFIYFLKDANTEKNNQVFRKMLEVCSFFIPPNTVMMMIYDILLFYLSPSDALDSDFFFFFLSNMSYEAGFHKGFTDCL